jgi:hypothetical protein
MRIMLPAGMLIPPLMTLFPLWYLPRSRGKLRLRQVTRASH